MEAVTSADGTEIAYERTGEGPPLVLVHGMAGDHRGWDEVSPRLASSFTVYAVDRRGRGESGDAGASANAESYAIEREYEDVAAVVEAAAAEADGDDETTLLGHSYGAICSLNAILETDDVDRLLLYEPPLGDVPVPGTFADDLETVIDESGAEAGLETFLRDAVGLSDAAMDAMRAGDVWAARVDAASTIPREVWACQRDLFDPDAFAGVAIPVTMFVGGESKTTMREAAEAVVAAFENGRLVSLPGQEHVANQVAPAAFVGAVLDALAA